MYLKINIMNFNEIKDKMEKGFYILAYGFGALLILSVLVKALFK